MSEPAPPGLTDAERRNEGVFSQVSFHIIETDIEPADVQQLRETLIRFGGTEHIGKTSRDIKFDLDGLSHVVAATIDFEGYERVEECFVNVVRPDWVHNALVKGKLPNPKQFSADPRMIFSGLVVCVAGDIPEGEKDAIIGGVLAMGGLFAGQMSRQVTHVVAMSMSSRECRVVSEKKLQCQIVLPYWFDDCLRLSSRIDEEPYTLPNPALLDGEKFELKKVERPDMATAMYLRPGHLPDYTGSESSRIEDLDVFERKNIMLHKDLDLSPHLRGTIEDLITVSKGKVVSKVHDADVLVCQWREGFEYRLASQQSKAVGNLSWLYHLISHNKWTSPFKRLLHYPFAKSGIPGFANYKLSLSNYSGEARVYLENLAKAAGSTFTKAFKMENTHLITAHERSEKVDAAKEWGINIVNHLWLEDCYAKWEIQPVDLDRYTYMPPKTNMGEVVGQTRIDREALEKHFYPKASSLPKFTAPLDDSEDETVDPVHEDDIFMTADANNDNAPTEPEDTGSIMQDKDRNAGSGSSINPETPTTDSEKKKRLSRPSKSASKMSRTPKTPNNLKIYDGKENEVPPTTGGRSAKAKAAASLHSLASDIELYQKEAKRVGGVVYGGRPRKEDMISPRPPSRKRSASAEDGPDADSSDDEEPDRKKSRGPPKMRLLITGWGSGKASEAKAALRDIGILLTEDASRCTHMAASRILRTKKFVCALAYAPTVVSTAFVEDSLAHGQILDAEKYPLKDSEGEKNHNVNFKKSIQNARENRRSLFKGMTIYLTKEVKGGYDTLAEVIKANGGQPLLFQGRPGAIPMRRASSADDEDDETSRTIHLVRSESGADVKLGEKFEQMAEKAHWDAKIASTDWLLSSALAQELKDESEYPLDERPQTTLVS